LFLAVINHLFNTIHHSGCPVGFDIVPQRLARRIRMKTPDDQCDTHESRLDLDRVRQLQAMSLDLENLIGSGGSTTIPTCPPVIKAAIIV
jgi:hypothetical protein